MTSASELFQSRRSRNGGRNPVADPSPAPLPSDLRHRRRRRGFDHNSHEDCNPFRRSRPVPRSGSSAEHELIRPDHATTGEYRTSNSRTAAARSSRVSMFCLNSSDRLPSTVLLAQARLAERLRGVSLVRSRQVTRVPSISWDEFEADDDLTIVDSGIWEPENLIERFESAIRLIDIGRQANQEFLFQNPRNKPPGLTLEEICSLDCKTFKEVECDETVELLECSICLDKFHEGDALLRLYCGHRFHYICLAPWLQSCGDCPNCRETVKTSVSLAERH